MIAAMVSGRLKDSPKWSLVAPRFTTTHTTAAMIATDASNRARVIELETDDDEIGRTLRKLNAGAMFTASGEISLSPTAGKLAMRVRTLTIIQVGDEGATQVASHNARA